MTFAEIKDLYIYNSSTQQLISLHPNCSNEMTNSTNNFLQSKFSSQSQFALDGTLLQYVFILTVTDGKIISRSPCSDHME